MKITPYLNFDGNCEEAFQFYEKTLGGKIQFTMTFGDSPMAKEYPALAKKILHTALKLGDDVIAGADCPPGEYEKPQGLRVTINVDSPAEADRIFKALAEKGNVTMECQETFWAARFGMVDDRFGTPWMINCEKKQ